MPSCAAYPNGTKTPNSEMMRWPYDRWYSEKSSWEAVDDEGERGIRQRLSEALMNNDSDTLLSFFFTARLLRSAQRGRGRVKPGRPAPTDAQYISGLAALFSWADGHGTTLGTLTPRQTRIWLASLRASGKSASTIQVLLSAARAFENELAQAGVSWGKRGSPLAGIQGIRDSRAPWERSECYAADEVAAMLAACSDLPRIQIVVLLGYDAGLRVSEMAALTPNDIDRVARVLSIRQSKRGKSRRIQTSDRLIDALGRYLSGGRVAAHVPLLEWSEAAIRRQIKRFCLDHTLPYRGIHALRHAHATRLEANGVDLLELSRHLGHTSLQTTQVYLKSNPESGVARALQSPPLVEDPPQTRCQDGES